MAHTCNASYSKGRDQEDQGLRPTWQIVWETLSQKYPAQKKAGRVTQGVEHLPSKCDALSSKPITSQNKNPPNQKN
jgi:hypothetical protein